MPSYPEITSKKIKYNSPSGFVHIGKYVPPFEKVKEGYGFMGVIVEDWNSEKLQCHICGKWFENIPTHLRHAHNITANDYKKNYGLLQSTALKSKRLRIRQSEVMQKLRGKNKANRHSFSKKNSFAGNRKNTKRAVEGRNKYGVCDLQIMQKVIELKKELGKTPTLTQLVKRYGCAFVFHLHKRYGSYVKYCQDLGFDANYSNFNPKYTKEYFIEKALSNEPTMRIFTLNEYAGLRRHFGNLTNLRKFIKEMKETQNDN